MPRWLKITSIVISSFLIFVFVVWMGVSWYVTNHKAALLKNITEQLNENINGTIQIEDIEPQLIRGFPGISLSLKNVILRDSLWKQHHKDLLMAKYIYVSVNAFSILKGAPRIRDVNLADASIYLFTDSTGYSNTSIFRQSKDTTKAKGKPRINHLTFTNVRLTFENDTKFKLFRFDFRKLVTELNYNANGWSCRLNVNAQVQDMAFNTHNGSFLKNKNLQADLKLSYSNTDKALSIPMQQISLNNDVLRIGGKFDFSTQPSRFMLNIKADDIKYKNALSLVSPNISKKLKLIDLKKPINLQAFLTGLMKFRDTPLVKISWQAKDNQLITPGGNVDDVTFDGTFINEKERGPGHNDPNSMISMKSFAGSYYTIPFKASNVVISNLIYPVIEGRFQSSFPLEQINNVTGAESFAFKGGTATMDLLYKAGLREKDTTIPYIIGDVIVKDAAFTYVPRGLPVSNSQIKLHFAGSDLYVQNARLQVQHSILNFSGAVKNFLYLYYRAPEQIVLDWTLSSPMINLSEFTGFLSRRSSATPSKKPGAAATSGAGRQSKRLDEVLDKSTVRVQATISKLVYQQFTATDIKATATLAQNHISLSNTQIRASGGRLLIDAEVDQRGNSNMLSASARVESVEVKPFFTAFNNFGQDAIMAQNLNGSLSATANVKGTITSAGKIVPGTLHGEVGFNLKDGALINFGPFQKIGKYVFRNRNLNNVTFSDVKNTLLLKGNNIVIQPMEIESSAINMFIEGVYGLKGGTLINIDVPLRNPKKDEYILDDSLRQERNTKGLVIHLKAVDGDDGNVRIALTRKGKVH